MFACSSLVAHRHFLLLLVIELFFDLLLEHRTATANAHKKALSVVAVQPSHTVMLPYALGT